ncbi:histidinol-phosphate transaminase [Buchnera aphidicola]|uniref:histidinol-phosphate transaminase n=1 Tax=Buchnera aphidicola TaxID=9 RepID=UPI0034641626
MKSNLNNLTRINIQNLSPYQSARRIGGHGDTWLNANESPMSALFKCRVESFNRYPECQPNNLISAYADYVGLFRKEILVTRGADEGIELLIKAFCEPKKDAIIYCPPTYDMYAINAKIANVKIKEIPILKNTWKIDLFNLQASLDGVKLIYICNPNNPTGNIFSKKDLIILLQVTFNRCLVVIDEAYIEFSSKDSMVSYLKEFPNLIILRTLSKAFALAGIRCGFTLANEEIINILHKVISPYPISTVVTDIAIQALEKNEIKNMQNRVIKLNKNRVWLINKLKKNNFVKKIFDSHANYILVKFYMFKRVFQHLWEKGIIIRNQDHKINLQGCLRISIGSDKECLRLIEELKNLSKI